MSDSLSYRNLKIFMSNMHIDKEEYLSKAYTALEKVYPILNLPYYQDNPEANIKELLKHAKTYGIRPAGLNCRKAVAENLVLRRCVLGFTTHMISHVCDIPEHIILSYERGSRSILLNRKEFTKAAVLGYLCDIQDFKELFVYGSSFYTMASQTPLFPDKSRLFLCKNPFFPC